MTMLECINNAFVLSLRSILEGLTDFKLSAHKKKAGVPDTGFTGEKDNGASHLA